MTDGANKTMSVLRSVWSTEELETERAVAEDCGPQKTCRNMKHVTFDGMAEPGSDLGTAWREKLAREGKLGSGSLADLVFGKS
ncbi:hypothetical protein [Nocardioides sp.]|uniref:hypothetical protein n=1 Tax=Nocardioides sp. TaxID=35761 RepID=UPI0039E4FBAE